MKANKFAKDLNIEMQRLREKDEAIVVVNFFKKGEREAYKELEVKAVWETTNVENGQQQISIWVEE